LRTAEQPSVVVHIPPQAFRYDGRVATLRLPTDAPIARCAGLAGVLLREVEAIALRSSLGDEFAVRLAGADGERRELVVEFGCGPDEGVAVLGPPVDLEVVFTESRSATASLRGWVEFW
jgi:hypothetical protein